MLSGVNVALGVTGSIAAVRVVELAHELRRRGAEVRGVMTHGAQGIIDPWALEFATVHPVVTELTGAVEHIELCGEDGWADVLLIAPATANTVGKMAAAVDVAPAMHQPMYDHPGVLDAIERLEGWGVRFVDPRMEEGKAKIAENDAIALAAARAAGPSPLAGKHVVVTSGATAESVDPVRVLTNRASGKTGRAVAKACYVRGADVTLVHGVVGPRPVAVDPELPPRPDIAYADLVRVEDTREMIDAAMDAAAGADALVSAAAISDYTMDAVAEKIRSGDDDLTLELIPTSKLLDGVREAHPDIPIVGFKVETSGDDDAMVAAAREVVERVGLSFMVANDASVMGAEETRALFVGADGVSEFVGSKPELGLRVANELADEL